MLREFSIIIVAIVVGTIAMIGIISSCFMGPDNVVQIFCEDLIEEETGVHVDLSTERSQKPPETPQEAPNSKH